MIVIPMAGQSRRFIKAGYDRPKYMLPISETSLFAVSVASFSHYFSSHAFLFIYRDIAGTDAFVRTEATRLGITEAHFVLLDAPTAGQAETVALGIKRACVAPSEAITVFNIDTIRPNFRFPTTNHAMECDGYLEVFRGSGSNWSFVGADAADLGRVTRTTEKEPISDLCSTGLYHFAEARFFSEAYAEARSAHDTIREEYYIAPLYNRLIARGLEIRYNIIAREDVVFSGVPAEYEDMLRTWVQQ